jgi:hypothetical protein
LAYLLRRTIPAPESDSNTTLNANRLLRNRWTATSVTEQYTWLPGFYSTLVDAMSLIRSSSEPFQLTQMIANGNPKATRRPGQAVDKSVDIVRNIPQLRLTIYGSSFHDQNQQPVNGKLTGLSTTLPLPANAR